MKSTSVSPTPPPRTGGIAGVEPVARGRNAGCLLQTQGSPSHCPSPGGLCSLAGETWHERSVRLSATAGSPMLAVPPVIVGHAGYINANMGGPQ